jgi:subtilisin family serine protease
MKNLIVFVLVLLSTNVYSQSALQKIAPKLQSKLEITQPAEKLLIWVYFTDKGNNVDSYLSNPQTVVSQKSLDRRSKVLDRNNLIDITDIPVNQNYVMELVRTGFQLKQKSKWLNAVSGFANQLTINQIANKSFVRSIDVVGTFSKNDGDVEFKKSEYIESGTLQPAGVNSLNYGNSYTQLNLINVPAVHDSGYNGTGVTICVLDAGFDNLPHEAFSSMNIIAAYDFVNNDPNVANQGDMGEGSHGTATLSIIGGFKEGSLIGPAYGADFILAKTENTDSETPVEEDNWVAALEWADSIGVDVTSTSLGYLDYDPPFTSYTWQDMDGNTAIITIAGDLAVAKGIVVVNSAGNNGFDPTHNTLGAPADGDSVIAIGAVTSSGTRTSFSSVGPTADGRIKPDLMAMGSNVYHAGSVGNQYWSGGGTSYSCPLVAGVCAILLQKNPSLTPMEVLQILRSTASLSSNPNNEYGWGIIDALDAINSTVVPVELVSFKAEYLNGKVELQWITASETNNYGFEVERRDYFGGYQAIGFVSGNGSSTNRITYNFIDSDMGASAYVYRLKQIDLDGSYVYSNEVEVLVTGLNDFKLFQNYPNPFNPVTNLRFIVPEEGNVKIALYDVLGNEVKILLNENIRPGSYNISVDGSGLSSGTYFVKMQTKIGQQIVKMSLLK